MESEDGRVDKDKIWGVPDLNFSMEFDCSYFKLKSNGLECPNHPLMVELIDLIFSLETNINAGDPGPPFKNLYVHPTVKLNLSFLRLRFKAPTAWLKSQTNSQLFFSHNSFKALYG